ncbi:type IVB secretion system protein IcmH/DotU [Agaribacterium sp. ZY112]|uniref:type IVB secretion system protein IcmH/DotU n=1 Tax=Agaribacterium sp. ZY112 TaxID=3233574 RepID=UPI00352357AF
MSNQNNGGFTPPPAPTGADRTVMIPTPGGARSGATPPPQQAQPTPAAMFQAQEQIALRRGLNPLVNSAATVLTVVIKLRTTLNHGNVPDLHKRLTDELKAFESKAKNSGAAPETVVTARYLLCAVIDEVVLNTPWGTASGWSQHSLLSLFHQETFGGEKCFVILQRMLETPGSHLDILELFYLCLSLGFEGKYRLEQRGHEQLEQIRDNLYQTIENHRPSREPDLSPHWQGSVDPNSSMMNYIPMWVFASVVLAILVLSYSGFRYWLYDATSPMAEKISEQISEPVAQEQSVEAVESPADTKTEIKRFY